MSTLKTSENLTSDKFLECLVNGTPLLDVRAPIEFNKGAFPTAQNVPILNNHQRDLIGTDYTTNGQASAIELGLTLATPELRARRMRDWTEFIHANPNGYLYCFRGGLRSKTTQQWLAQSGCDYPLVEGGYKAMRRFLLNECQRLCDQGNIIVVSGMTGVGKTEFIQTHSNAIDIEGRALHRGSAFGKLFTDQPEQINWENQVIIDWLKCEAQSSAPILIEAESHQIGKVHVPQALQNAMANAPRVMLTAPLTERIARLYNDYIDYQLRYYKKTEKDPWNILKKRIQANLLCIRKRLGGVRYQFLCAQLPGAIDSLCVRKDACALKEIISTLLEVYYDPQYQYHNERNRAKMVFTGNVVELRQFLDQRCLE